MQSVQTLRSSSSFSEPHRAATSLRLALGLSGSRLCLPNASTRRHGVPPVRAVSEKERVVEQFSRLAADATITLREVTERTIQSISSTELLHQQTEQTAAELKAQAELLRVQALQASSRLTSALGRTEEERAALLRRGNEALYSAAGQLRAHTLAASSKVSTLLQEVGTNKAKLLEVVQAAPEPIKEIAETAVIAHSPEAARKGAVIHDFCLGITFGGALVTGGLFWFLCTGSINAIRFGFLLGGILLAAAVGSLKAWQAGKSSTPYIALQAVSAYVLFARETFRYYQTKALFPTAAVAVLSIAMVAFYVYVVLAGGNPSPKTRNSPAVP